jgi:hypothetical protein
MTTTALTRLLAAIDALEDGTKGGLGPGYENGQGVEVGTELQAAREQARSAIAQAGEPFGYFRAEPFGWTNCAETDEGAIALYTHPAADVDGDRYRLLRRGQHWSVVNGIGDILRAEGLDAAIDAAMKGGV